MNDILLGKGAKPVSLLGRYANRHGLVAGATGTGKTVSLMVLAEGFSRMGVPVFMADVKGDVAGLAVAGTPSDRLAQRAADLGVEHYVNEANPVMFWDLYGRAGHPIRATISEIGPTLLGRILELNDTQAGVLEITFKLADDKGLLLLDLDDLRALLGFVADRRKDVSTEYGLVSATSIAAIQRALLTLDRDGGRHSFGEPALDLTDLMRTDLGGRGVISILAADQLILKPRLYSTFLLWLLSDLFEQLGVGEALVSTLQEKGVPMPVERTMVAPPRSRIGAISTGERAAVRGRSPVGTKYDTPVNRESAYERLTQRATDASASAPPAAPRSPAPSTPQEPASTGASSEGTQSALGSKVNEWLWGTKRRQGMVETLAKQTVRTVGSQIGRQIIRGVLGGIMGGSSRRR